MLSRNIKFNRKELAVCGLLLLAVALVFGQTVRHEFFNLDDNVYVYSNPHVMGGLVWSEILQAFTQGREHLWIPLTWISLMADAELYDFHAGGYHLTNVLLHAAAAMLLFVFLHRTTSRLWPSAFAAALFAIHPLRVESVAWVTERKDVLSGMFFMLTLLAYVGYVRRPFSFWRYALVVVLFALGLMAKPMLVTLPFVLLLLDYWPLGRMDFASQKPPATLNGQPQLEPVRGQRRSAFRICVRLIAEKLPLLIVAAADGLMTMSVQNTALNVNERLSVAWRIGNAMISYLTYLESFFYPVGLFVVYPRLGADLPTGRLVVAVLVLLAVTAFVIVVRRSRPYLLVGWFWYLGMSIPVIGFLQVGLTAVADRFTYLPQIGLAVALTWTVADWGRHASWRRWTCGVGAAIVLTSLMARAAYQTSFWQDAETLWSYTLACEPDSAPAHNNLGDLLAAEGRLDEAMAHFQRAIEVAPNSEYPHYNRGHLLEILGRRREAVQEYATALELNPGFTPPCNRLGLLLAQSGRYEAAIAFFEKSLALDADSPETLYDLGKTLSACGRREESEAVLQRAAKLAPNYAVNHNRLGLVVAGRGRTREAIEHFQRAVDAKPDYVEARSHLAQFLAKDGRIREAADQYEALLKIDPSNAEAREALARLQAVRADAPQLDVSSPSATMGPAPKGSGTKPSP